MHKPFQAAWVLRRLVAVLGGLLVGCAGWLASAQEQQEVPPIARLLPPQPEQSAAQPPQSPPPIKPTQVPSAPETEDAATKLRRLAMPINLPVALRLTLANNLDLVQVREVVNQAGINLDRALISYLPTFNLGSGYSHHEGNIQKTEGNIIKANKDALFVNGGPSLALSLSDALFAPLVARQVALATKAGEQRVTNDTLLLVADAYFAVLRARRQMARIEETLEYLTADRAAPGRADSKGLLPVVQSIHLAGGVEVSKAEVERVRVEILRRQEEKVIALQDFRIAMAELARLVRLDPQIPLWPIEDFRFSLPLPGDAWGQQPLTELVRAALQNRPELAENQALIQAAVERVRTAKYRPFLPNLVLNYNWGDFGGDPNLNPNIVVPATATSPAKTIPQVGFGGSGEIHHFAPRTDFDVSVVWKFQNMGLGDLANIREQQSRLRQEQAAKIQVQDRIIAQVVQANELVQGSRHRVEVTRRSLFDATGAARGPVFEAIRLGFDRIRAAPPTRPLEVLDSIRGLNNTLEAYGQAITDYERYRFRLLIVLGLPPQELLVPPVPEGTSPPTAKQ